MHAVPCMLVSTKLNTSCTLPVGAAIKDMSMRVPDNIKMDDDKARKRMAKKLEKQQVPQRTVVEKKVSLFSHLHQCEHEVSLTQSIPYVVHMFISITASTNIYRYYSKFARDHYLGWFYIFRHGYHTKTKKWHVFEDMFIS